MSLTLSRLTRGRVSAPDALSYITSGQQPLNSPIPLSAPNLDNELGVCQLTTEAGTFLPLIKRGLWQRLSGTSISTQGVLSELLPISNPDCLPGVIQTEHGPLTKGYGDAQLAGIEDVQVWVDGAPRSVAYVEPTLGIIVTTQSIQPGSEVKVSYFYTPNPVLPLASWNTPGYAWNKLSNQVSYAGPFAFTNVFNLTSKAPQPVQYGYTYTASDAQYSGVFNDFTSFLFNEVKDRLTIPPLSRTVSEQVASYEGQNDPVSVGWSGSGGTLTGSGQLRIEDDSETGDLRDQKGAFYSFTQDYSFEGVHRASFRFQILGSSATQGDFLGLGAGWTTIKDLILVSTLSQGGVTFLGLLGPTGDESSWESYKGLTLTVDPRIENNVTFYDRFITSIEPGYLPGDQLYTSQGVLTVQEVLFEENTFKVLTTSEVPSTVTEFEGFKVIDFSGLQTYRVFQNETGTIFVYQGGNPAPIISYQGELPQQEELFLDGLSSNVAFFGSVSRQASSESLWDFYRSSRLPLQSLEQTPRVFRQSPFNVLPEQTPSNPWTRMTDQGSASIVSGDFLNLTHAGKADQGTFSYARIEPLLSQSSNVDLQARFRLNSFVPGTFSSFLTIADDLREVTLAFFTAPVGVSGTDYASYRASQGFFEIDAQGLASQGFLTPPTILASEFVFTTRWDATEPFSEVTGWTVTNEANLSQTYIDHSSVFSKISGVTSKASYPVTIVNPQQVFDRYVYELKFKVDSYQLNGFGKLPLTWGMDDLDIQLFVSLLDLPTFRGLVFTDELGNILADILGDPLGVPFDWDDQSSHTYKIQRTEDVITVFIDGAFQGTFDRTQFQSSTGVEFSFDLNYESEAISLEIDYVLTHSTSYSQRLVGIYKGGSYFDPGSYDFQPLEYLGSFVDLRVIRTPSGSTQIFSGSASLPLFDLQYSELPFRVADTEINTSLGYVRFGSLDPLSLASQTWDYLNYVIGNQRLEQLSLQHSAWNDLLPATSAEPVFDQTLDTYIVQADNESQIFLGNKALCARKVISVTSEDGAVSYDFSFDETTQEITLLNLTTPLNRDSFKILILAKGPFSSRYLQNQEPVLILNEGTPPYELSQVKRVEALEVPFTQFNDPNFTFNGDLDFVFSDGRLRLIFDFEEDKALYNCLDINQSLVSGDSEDLLSTGCDDLGFVSFELEGYTDTYEVPEPAPDGFGQYEQGFFFDRVTHTFDSIDHVFEPVSNTDVTASLEDLREDAYDGAEDLDPTGVLTELEGYVFDSTSYGFDQVAETFDSYGTSDTVLDFQNTVNFP